MLKSMSGIGGLINVRHNGELEYQHLSSRNGPEIDRGDKREHKDDWFFHVWHFQDAVEPEPEAVREESGNSSFHQLL